MVPAVGGCPNACVKSKYGTPHRAQSLPIEDVVAVWSVCLDKKWSHLGLQTLWVEITFYFQFKMLSSCIGQPINFFFWVQWFHLVTIVRS
jgi:hypothetical protein